MRIVDTWSILARHATWPNDGGVRERRRRRAGRKPQRRTARAQAFEGRRVARKRGPHRFPSHAQCRPLRHRPSFDTRRLASCRRSRPSAAWSYSATRGRREVRTQNSRHAPGPRACTFGNPFVARRAGAPVQGHNIPLAIRRTMYADTFRGYSCRRGTQLRPPGARTL